MSRVLMDVAQSYGNLVMCYVDDVIYATGTIDEHIDRIAEVLSRLREAGLKCKPSKCEFLKCSIKYLGRIVDRKGVRLEDAEEAFEITQKKLCSAAVLALPRQEGIFILDTDASEVAKSGILQQKQEVDGKIKVRPIAYDSKILNPGDKSG